MLLAKETDVVGSRVVSESALHIGYVWRILKDQNECVNSVLISETPFKVASFLFSTYYLPVHEICAVRSDGVLVVLEGAEKRAIEAKTGILERLKISTPLENREDTAIFYLGISNFPDDDIGTDDLTPRPKPQDPHPQLSAQQDFLS